MSGKTRILIRSVIGKILLNVGFFKGQKFELYKAQLMQFSAYITEEDENKVTTRALCKLNVKFKKEDIEKVLRVAKDMVASLG